MSSIIWLRKFGTILVQSSVSCVLHYMPVLPQDVPLVLVLFMTPLKGLALQAATRCGWAGKRTRSCEWGGSWNSRSSSGPGWPQSPLLVVTFSERDYSTQNWDKGRTCVSMSRWRQTEPGDTGRQWPTPIQTCSTWPHSTRIIKDSASEDDMNKMTNTESIVRTFKIMMLK